MKMRLSALHHLLKPVTVLIGLMTILQAVPVRGERLSVEASACVRVVVQSSFPVNGQVTFFNLKSGQVSRDDRPTIPPNAYLSPDGKAAVFLQAISETQIGIYMEAISSRQSTLLDVTTSADLFSIAP